MSAEIEDLILDRLLKTFHDEESNNDSRQTNANTNNSYFVDCRRKSILLFMAYSIRYEVREVQFIVNFSI